MSFVLSIPRPNDALELTLEIGQSVFVLGANGTGKSSLMHLFYRSHRAAARRISAHRQTWFESNALNMTAATRRDSENSMSNRDSNPDSRWKDHYSAARASMAIYDLVDAENVRAREITAAVDDENIDLAKRLAKRDAPIKLINELLRLSNIPVEISVKENEQVFASKSGGPLYSVAELSDGERNALLIAADVLTAKANSLILIDEPERHLHRSIISPLLTLLFAKRPDCSFVVSTHDVMLPMDNPKARTLLVRDCLYSGASVSSWNVDLLPAEAAIDDDLKGDILGARRKILFVEGNERSLDKPLYALVFPSVSVVPKSSCREVEQATVGTRSSADLHWLTAFGVVDNDRRCQEEIDILRSKGVHALPLFSIESIYYHPEVQRRVATRQAIVVGADVDSVIAAAKDAAVASIRTHVQRLSERAIERQIRAQVMRQLPGRAEIVSGAPVSIQLDVATLIAQERSRLEAALEAMDLATIIAKYPVRETPAPGVIADRLGFQDRLQYEAAVRKMLIDEDEGLLFVRSLFGDLAESMAS